MANNKQLSAGSADGAVIATDEVAGIDFQLFKLVDGTEDSTARIAGDATNGLDVDVTRIADSSTRDLGIATVDGAVDIELAGTAVTGGAGAVAAGTPRVTLASDDPAVALLGTMDADTGNIASSASTIAGDTTSIDGKITACDTGAVVVTNSHSADYDTGAGTDTTIAFGIAVPANGGAAVVPGDATAGLKVDLGSDNDVTLATLPDTSGGDLASMATDLGTLAAAVSTEMQVDVVGSLPSGTNAIGKLAANSGVDIGDVDVTSISAGSNLIGDVGISGARTSGGTTSFRSLDVDETEDEVKSSGGQVYWIHAMNLTAAVLYLKFYNAAAASVTVGTTTPVHTFPIPTLGDTNGAGFNFSVPNGIAFSTGITIACTTGILDNSTTGPAANGCVVNLGYA